MAQEVIMLPDIPGTYVLIIYIPATKISVGKLGNISLKEGYYAYIGSAMGGIKNRVGRHLNNKKKLRWHIDYLLSEGTIKQLVIIENKRVECNIASIFRTKFEVIYKFGASDCKCTGHLFYSSEYLKFLIVLRQIEEKCKILELE